MSSAISLAAFLFLSCVHCPYGLHCHLDPSLWTIYPTYYLLWLRCLLRYIHYSCDSSDFFGIISQRYTKRLSNTLYFTNVVVTYSLFDVQISATLINSSSVLRVIPIFIIPMRKTQKFWSLITAFLINSSRTMRTVMNLQYRIYIQIFRAFWFEKLSRRWNLAVLQILKLLLLYVILTHTLINLCETPNLNSISKQVFWSILRDEGALVFYSHINFLKL